MTDIKKSQPISESALKYAIGNRKS